MKNKKINFIASQFKKEAVVPFWMWNDKLDKVKLSQQLLDIKSKGMNQVIIHPRFGLETNYLSNEWFEIVGFVLEIAKKNNMKIWIYDELNWPSGYAGGKLLEQYPELSAKHLIKSSNGYTEKETSWKPAYSNNHYVDVLNPQTTDIFIKLVYREYWSRFKKHFGTTLVGFFTDEPGMYNNFANLDPNSIPWTKNLPNFFELVNGYKLSDSLNLIFDFQGHKSVEARIDYWNTISILYQKSYFRKLQSWCHKHSVAFIGHVLVEENMVDTAKTQGNFFTTMKHLDFAGYDLLARLEPKTIIASKLASSAAKAYNLNGVLAETFGIFGWDLTYNEMKRVVKWQSEQGLNILIPHALYYSLRGDRYNDCPPSFMEKRFWKKFRKFVEFSKKLLHKKDNQQTTVAIYYPIETVWAYLSPNNTAKSEGVDNAFQVSSYSSYNIGLNFDYLPEQSILNNKLGNYKFLILPKTEVVSMKVMNKIIHFQKTGGVVICINGFPSFASKMSDQDKFKKLWNDLKPHVKYISLQSKLTNQNIITKFKINTKNFLQQKIPSIWLARGIRIAKMFGYNRPINVNYITGIEEELKILTT